MQLKVSKTALNNIIRHTGSHNRAVEENECWRKHNKQKTAGNDDKLLQSQDFSDSPPSSTYSRNKPIHSTALSTVRMGAHMDCAEVLQRRSYEGRDEVEKNGNFWMKKLYDAEAADHDRWGHNGYKELYPREFDYKDIQQSSSTEDETINRDIEKCRKSRGKKRHRSEVNDDNEDQPKKRRKKSKKSKFESDCTKKVKRKRSDSNEKNRKKRSNHSEKKEKECVNVRETDDDTDSDRDGVTIRRRKKHKVIKRIREQIISEDSINLSHSAEHDTDRKEKKRKKKKSKKINHD